MAGEVVCRLLEARTAVSLLTHSFDRVGIVDVPLLGFIFRRVLQTIPLFRELPESDLQQLLGLLTERTFQAGEEIVAEGRPQDDLSAGYLVVTPRNGQDFDEIEAAMQLLPGGERRI